MRDNDPDWCYDHQRYPNECFDRHDPPHRDDLPDPWPAARPDEDDEE